MNLRWEYFLVSFNPTICYKMLIKISGMGVHIVIVLYYTARPKVEVEIRQVTCGKSKKFLDIVKMFDD